MPYHAARVFKENKYDRWLKVSQGAFTYNILKEETTGIP
jgi:hypothetical protein